MTSTTPPAGTPGATGVATGSLGTGTAVDDETTLMAVPDVPESTLQPAAVLAPAALPAPAAMPLQAPETAPAQPRVAARRDPYRPIGIALAAILVALAGIAALSSGGDTPAQFGAPAATASPGDATGGDDENGDEDDDGNNGNNGNNGNGNGRGNGNGNGGDNGRGNDD